MRHLRRTILRHPLNALRWWWYLRAVYWWKMRGIRYQCVGCDWITRKEALARTHVCEGETHAMRRRKTRALKSNKAVRF